MTMDALLRGSLFLPARLVNRSDVETNLLEKKFISLEGLTFATEPSTLSVAPFDMNFEFLYITSFLDLKAYMPAFFRYRVYIQAGKDETTQFLQNVFCHRKLNLLRSSHIALVLKATPPKHSDPFMAGSAPQLSQLFDTTHFLLYAEKPLSSQTPYSIYSPLRLFAVPLMDPQRFINLYCPYKPGESEDEDAKVTGYEIEQALAQHKVIGKYAGIIRPPRSTIRPEFRCLRSLDEQKKNEEQRESEKQKQKLLSEKRSRLDNAVRRGKKKKVKISSDLPEVVVKNETGGGVEGAEEVIGGIQKEIEIEEITIGKEILGEGGAEKAKKQLQKLPRISKPLNSTPRKISTKSPRAPKTTERKRKEEGFEQENKKSLKTALLQSCKTVGITRVHENFNSYWNLIYRSCQFALRKQMETYLIPKHVLQQISNMQVTFYEDQAKIVEKIMLEFGDRELEKIEEQDDVCFVKTSLTKVDEKEEIS